MDNLVGVFEIGGAEVAEFGNNEDILLRQALDLRFGGAPHQQVGQLFGHTQNRGQLLFGQHLRGNIDGDDDVRPHASNDANRQIIGHTAIHEQLSLYAHRCEHAGHGHAGPEGIRQAAARQNHLFTRHQVGGDRPERDWQLVEIIYMDDRLQDLVKNLVQVLSFDNSKGQLDLALVEPQAVWNQEFALQFLFAHGPVGPGGAVR